MKNHMNALPNILTCMSRRVMKPLPSMSQIWKELSGLLKQSAAVAVTGRPLLVSLRWDARFTLEATGAG